MSLNHIAWETLIGLYVWCALCTHTHMKEHVCMDILKHRYNSFLHEDLSLLPVVYSQTTFRQISVI